VEKNQTCHCAKPNDPGEESPNSTPRKVKGKRLVAESFISPAALAPRAQAKSNGIHDFQQRLSQQFRIATSKTREDLVRGGQSRGSGVKLVGTPEEKKKTA